MNDSKGKDQDRSKCGMWEWKHPLFRLCCIHKIHFPQSQTVSETIYDSVLSMFYPTSAISINLTQQFIVFIWVTHIASVQPLTWLYLLVFSSSIHQIILAVTCRNIFFILKASRGLIHVTEQHFFFQVSLVLTPTLIWKRNSALFETFVWISKPLPLSLPP